ncbi:hypothetical protein [Halobellus ruber]|nr:hypothetical protein [Halobellus ruber]
MTTELHAPIYGVSCVCCGTLLLRGPSDAELCAGCQRDLRRVQR